MNELIKTKNGWHDPNLDLNDEEFIKKELERKPYLIGENSRPRILPKNRVHISTDLDRDLDIVLRMLEDKSVNPSYRCDLINLAVRDFLKGLVNIGKEVEKIEKREKAAMEGRLRRVDDYPIVTQTASLRFKADLYECVLNDLNGKSFSAYISEFLDSELRKRF